MKKEIFEGSCSSLNENGYGVVHYKDKKVLVKNMLPGEVAKLTMSNFDKYNTYASIHTLIKKSKDRVETKCPYTSFCGGCQIQHMSFQSQNEYKQNRVIEEFKKYNIKCTIHPILSDPNPWFYRNKVSMIVSFDKQRNVVFGFNEFNSNQLSDIPFCFTQNEISNDIVKKIKELVIKYRVMPYNKETKKGLLRYILIKYGLSTNEIMIVFVTNGKEFKARKIFVSELLKAFPNIKTIIQNINTRTDNLVLAKEEMIWYGNGYIQDHLLDLTFNISSKSFYQINPKQTQVLYSKVLEYAKLTGKETVLDAYCGIGTISLLLSKKAKHVIGVELIKDAITDAKQNARINKIKNVSFYTGDAMKFIVDMAKHKEKLDVVVVDPPRSGCSNELLNAVDMIKPKMFIYVSCDVSTQARDIGYLMKKGWKVEECQPVDMFPHTYHVESIIKMTRINK